MPFKKTVQGSQSNNLTEDVYRRIEALENGIKRMNTLEVYLKQVMQMEKRLGLMNIKDKEPKEPAGGIQAEPVKNLEKKLFLFVQNTIKAELEPIQLSIEGLSKRMSKMEKRIATLEKLQNENTAMYQSIRENQGMEQKKMEEGPSVIYQEFKIDRLFVDKYEQINNLGTVGIKELSGHLNIGTTYQNDAIPKHAVSEWKEKMNELNEMKESHKEAMEYVDQDKQDREST